jgi:hypothetical protein
MLSEAYDAEAAANGNSDVVRGSAAIVAPRPFGRPYKSILCVSTSQAPLVVRGQLELTEVNSFFCSVTVSVSVCGAPFDPYQATPELGVLECNRKTNSRDQPSLGDISRPSRSNATLPDLSNWKEMTWKG